MNLHLARFAVINVVGFALLAAGWLNGLVQGAFLSDPSGVTYVIASAFLVGLVTCAYQLLTLHRDARGIFTQHRLRRPLSAADGPLLRSWLGQRIKPVDDLSGRLMTLGFVGTLIGFLMAFSNLAHTGITIDTLALTISYLFTGMAVALYTTLLGLLLGGLWLGLCFEVLDDLAESIYRGE